MCAWKFLEAESERERARENERERESTYNCRAQAMTGRDCLMLLKELHEYAAAHTQMERGKHTQTVL